MDARFSYFTPPVNKTKQVPSGTWGISDVYAVIRGESLFQITSQIRSSAEKVQRTKLKQSTLPFVTFAGTFKYRNYKGLIAKSGFIALDIDHIGDKLQEIKTAILSEIRPALLFVSPSGDGLKVICSIDPLHEYSAYFDALKRFFNQQYSVTIDNCPDIARACFLCHDPSAFSSENPTLFDKSFLDSMGTGDVEETYSRCQKSVNKKGGFLNGNRHNYIASLAGMLNRVGIDQETAEGKLLEYIQPDFDDQEILGIVRRTYKQTDLFGISPMNITHGRDRYTTFPLKLLWRPQDQFVDAIHVILSDNYEHTTGDIPTSVKTSYLTDVRDGNLDPELFLLLAAVKSIIGHKNYTRTTRQYIFHRMYGGQPWRIFTKYFFQKLMDTAIEKKMMVKINTFPGFWVSIGLTVDEMKKAIMEHYEKKNEPKVKAKSASKEISEFKKAFSNERKHNTREFTQFGK